MVDMERRTRNVMPKSGSHSSEASAAAMENLKMFQQKKFFFFFIEVAGTTKRTNLFIIKDTQTLSHID